MALADKLASDKFPYNWKQKIEACGNYLPQVNSLKKHKPTTLSNEKQKIIVGIDVK